LSANPKSEERPQAPWGSFPLAELVILAGLVLLVVGFVSGSVTALAVGFTLAALGGLEVAAVEHFAGYRSHTTLLAGPAFVVVAGCLIYFAGLAPLISLAIAAGAVAAAVQQLSPPDHRPAGRRACK
jgi:uncharacterized membrane protein HdeD (DUF308 family)